MRTAIVIVSAAIAWLLVLAIATQPLIAASEGARAGPSLAFAYLAFVAALSLVAGLAVGRLGSTSHWSGAILGLVLAGGMMLLVLAAAAGLPVPGLLSVGIVVVTLIIPSAWCGAWLGSRRHRGSEDEQRGVPEVFNSKSTRRS
ncbi:MAG: hypothetical protein U9R79_14525 [Armatimonadota bacterium]|nr:hypothetical protein [Armatimonadota bacterium]